jgi:hypothetical protein
MELFENYFRLPFHINKFGTHIWDANGEMVLQFADIDIKKELAQDILTAINEGKSYSNSVFTYQKDEGLIYQSLLPIILIRGWGHLTSGTLNLPDHEAIAIQDNLAEFIVNRLNK